MENERQTKSNIEAIVKGTIVGTTLAFGVSLFTHKTPVHYSNAIYQGYHIEKADGNYLPVFNVTVTDPLPGGVGRPLKNKRVYLINRDKNFDCDDAYEKRGNHKQDSGKYDIEGYQNLLFGTYATKITSSK